MCVLYNSSWQSRAAAFPVVGWMSTRSWNNSGDPFCRWIWAMKNASVDGWLYEDGQKMKPYETTDWNVNWYIHVYPSLTCHMRDTNQYNGMRHGGFRKIMACFPRTHPVIGPILEIFSIEKNMFFWCFLGIPSMKASSFSSEPGHPSGWPGAVVWALASRATVLPWGWTSIASVWTPAARRALTLAWQILLRLETEKFWWCYDNLIYPLVI